MFIPNFLTKIVSIKCNPDHLDAINVNHDKLIEVSKKLVMETESLKILLLTNYEGKATDTLEEAFVPLLAHVVLLEQSYEVNKAAVEFTKNLMIKTDELLKNAFVIK